MDRRCGNGFVLRKKVFGDEEGWGNGFVLCVFCIRMIGSMVIPKRHGLVVTNAVVCFALLIIGYSFTKGYAVTFSARLVGFL